MWSQECLESGRQTVENDDDEIMLARRHFLKDKDFEKEQNGTRVPFWKKGDEKPWPPWTAAAAVLCLKEVLKGGERDLQGFWAE